MVELVHYYIPKPDKHPIPRAYVRLSMYRYGKITKRLSDAAKWINSNNRLIRHSYLPFILPYKLYRNLSPDEADFLESEIFKRLDYFWHYPDEKFNNHIRATRKIK